MKTFLISFIIMLSLLALSCTPHDRVVQDPLREGDYIIYRADGTKEQMIQDPFEKGDYLIFKDEDE